MKPWNEAGKCIGIFQAIVAKEDVGFSGYLKSFLGEY